MKLIVAIKSACRRPRSLIRHCFLPKGRAGREVDALRADDHRVVQILNGMEVGSIGSPAVTARNLCGDVPQGRAPLRHVVISAEDVTGAEKRREAFACLAAVAQDWIQAYAPNTNFLAVSHDDRRHPHIHLLLANSDRSDDESRLAWSPSTVSGMQSLDFVSDATKETYLVESGRHRGISRREQGGMPYPGAHMDALKLAKMSEEELKHYETRNELTVGRRNKAGQITSVVFRGRRIRLSTIRQMDQSRRSALPGRCAYHRNQKVHAYRPSWTRCSPARPAIGW